METQTPTQPQTQSTTHQTVVVMSKPKSVGVAFLLAFLFGPLGLLYASVMGGIVMFLAALVMFFVLPIIGGVIAWIGCIIWAVMAANAENDKAASGVRVNTKAN